MLFLGSNNSPYFEAGKNILQMVQNTFEAIRDIAALGMSILLDEQNARLALQVARRGYVMESGAITLSGAAGELLGSDAVQRAYLGG